LCSFAIPVVAMLIPIIGLRLALQVATRRRIDDYTGLWETSDANSIRAQTRPDWDEYQTRLAKIESAVRLLKLHAHSKWTCTDSGSSPQRQKTYSTAASMMPVTIRPGPCVRMDPESVQVDFEWAWQP